MDIKDFILIGGGVLIVLVIAHGFWIALRAKREPYRLDIVPDLVHEDIDEFERLRGELPNGPSRIISPKPDAEVQGTLDLGVSLDPILHDEPALSDNHPEIKSDVRHSPRTQTKAFSAGSRPTTDTRKPAPQPHQAPARGADKEADSPRARVAEVQLVTPDRTTSERKERDKPARPTAEPVTEATSSQDEPALAPDVEELLIVNVVAPRGKRFEGEPLVNALRRQGLRYGEMNIFHRVDTATKIKVFSVANLVEPGVFDLADLDALKSPGISFFLQLPGPEDALAALDDMLRSAQAIADELGGDMRDEQLSVLTGQAQEHMRQRIAEFARRKLFKRA